MISKRATVIAMDTSSHDPASTAPPNLDTLPPEILEAVFYYLDKPSLASILRVNWALLVTAYPILYRHIDLGDRFPTFQPLSGFESRLNSPLKYVYSLHVPQHQPHVCRALSTLLPPSKSQYLSSYSWSPAPSRSTSRAPSRRASMDLTAGFPTSVSPNHTRSSVHPLSSDNDPTPHSPSSHSGKREEERGSSDGGPGRPPYLPLLSLPATAHPNVREACPLVNLSPRTLVIRHAPLLYVRVTHSYDHMAVGRAILAFTPDSAVVGTNFKYEVAPDGPNGFLRRFPNARTVVWVFAVRDGENWRPSPRPRNAEATADVLEVLELDPPTPDGEAHKTTEEREDERKEDEYLATTWVGRLLSPPVLQALKRRCPALCELVLVNMGALDPVAVVQDDRGPGHVASVLGRWIPRVVRHMEGWDYHDHHASSGQHMDEEAEEGGKVCVRCLTLDEFVAEERRLGPAQGGVRMEEVQSWF